MGDGSRNGVNRRVFRCWRVIFMLVVFLAAAVPPAPGAGALGPCAQATSVATLAGPEEPGEKLVVTGTVFAPDGVTPAARVFLYVYHTDATGHYNRESGEPPRLRGW